MKSALNSSVRRPIVKIPSIVPTSINASSPLFVRRSLNFDNTIRNDKLKASVFCATMFNAKLIDFAIVTILQEELNAVMTRFDFNSSQPISPTDSNLTFFETKLQCNDGNIYTIIATRLFVAGNPNAASLCREISRFYKPNYVLLVGIGGGIVKNGLKIGDVTVADKVIYYEYSKVLSDREDYRSDPIACNSILVSKVKGLFEDKKFNDVDGEYTVKVGNIASGEKVIADLGFQDKLLKLNNNFLAVEMEAQGILTALNHENCTGKVLVIRGISDNGDGEKNDDFHALASNRAAELCLKLLSVYPVSKVTEEVLTTIINSDSSTNYLRAISARLRADRIFEIKSLGLNDDAEVFIEKILKIPVDPSLYPNSDKKIVMLLGERGQGKSLIVSKMFVETANNFLTKESQLFPLFINANAIDLSIEESIENELKRFDSSLEAIPISLIVIVDALDEIDQAKANKLLQEISFLAGYHTKLCFVITSRPFMQIPKAIIHKELSRLGQAESTELLESIAGDKARSIYYDRLSVPLKECLEIPLFAILFGVYLRDNNRWGIDSPYELINFMIQEALKKRSSQQSNQDRDIPFSKLAIHLKQSGLSKLQYHEIMTSEDRNYVVSSGLVREVDNELFFPLTIISDWFIARGFLSGQFNLQYFASQNVTLYDWLEPLKIATIIASYPKLIELFRIISQRDIALASYILDEAIGRNNYNNDRISTSELSSKDFWLRFRESMEIWLQTMDTELKKIIAPVNKESLKLNPLAIRRSKEVWGKNIHESFWYGWYKKNDRNPDEPLDLSTYNRDNMWEYFDSLHGASLRPAPYDMLTSSRNNLRDKLEKAIKEFGVVYEIPEAKEELAWGTALDLLRLDVRRTQAIPLSDIRAVLLKNPYHKLHQNGVVLHVDILKAKCEDLMSMGEREFSKTMLLLNQPGIGK